jgi:hypothetical protein
LIISLNSDHHKFLGFEIELLTLICLISCYEIDHSLQGIAQRDISVCPQNRLPANVPGQRRQITYASSPISLNRPLHQGCYAAFLRGHLA